jgi:hypothetical protein
MMRSLLEALSVLALWTAWFSLGNMGFAVWLLGGGAGALLVGMLYWPKHRAAHPIIAGYVAPVRRPTPAAPEYRFGPPLCPVCASVLQQVEEDGLLLDVCRDGCGGIWFDNHELRQAADPARAAATTAVVAARPVALPAEAFELKRCCPRCAGIIMQRRRFSESCRVDIDACPACGGIWLDHGEFEKISAHLAAAAEPAPDPMQAATLDPQAAILVAQLQAEMRKSRDRSQSRHKLCSFIGRKYHGRSI